jgi:hypothetical protein
MAREATEEVYFLEKNSKEEPSQDENDYCKQPVIIVLVFVLFICCLVYFVFGYHFGKQKMLLASVDLRNYKKHEEYGLNIAYFCTNEPNASKPPVVGMMTINTFEKDIFRYEFLIGNNMPLFFDVVKNEANGKITVGKTFKNFIWRKYVVSFRQINFLFLKHFMS